MSISYIVGSDFFLLRTVEFHFYMFFQLTNVKIEVVMNDTVGQLAATAYKYGQECIVGVVIGYG